jgi:hypothetical protein
MTTEFNELLPVSAEDKAQIWIIGSRNQVTHLNQRILRAKARQRSRPVHPDRACPICCG